MTTDERAKVEALCRKLFPEEIPSPLRDKRTIGHKGEFNIWNARLWETYHALIEVELL